MAAAVTAAARRAASASGVPRASSAASVAECVHPVPWVAVPSIHATGISRCSAPSKSRSDPAPSPPVIRTARAPRATIRSASVAAVTIATGEDAGLGEVRASPPSPGGAASAISTSTASGSSSVAPVLARRTGSTTSGVGCAREKVRDRDDDLRREQRSGLGRIDTDVVVDGLELRGDDPGGQRVGRQDRRGVLRGDADDRGHPVAAGGGERLEVSLDPGATAGIGRGDRQAARRCHPPIVDAAGRGLSRRPGAAGSGVRAITGVRAVSSNTTKRFLP